MNFVLYKDINKLMPVQIRAVRSKALKSVSKKTSTLSLFRTYELMTDTIIQESIIINIHVRRT